LTQPIRIDDAVVVEGEFGNVEDITLTYVVVRVWDKRRLIVPLSHFIEKPFQNWTRASADMLGTVEVYTDYTLPLADIRQEVKRLVEASPNWDRKAWNVQVTGATEKTMQVRVLASAANAGKAFDLRCEIREKLIEFIQKNHAQSLPKLRTNLDGSETFYQRMVASPHQGEAGQPGEGLLRETVPSE
jgi:small-conductance mechanosensitive channel